MVSGAAVRGVVAFGANLVLVRLLLPEHFGRFAIVQANISLIGALTNLKIGDLLLREPQDKLDERRLGLYVGALCLQTAVVGLASLLLLWALDLLRLDASILLLSVLGGYWVQAQMTLYERRFDYQRLSVLDTTAHGAGHLFAVAGALAGWGAIVLYLRFAVQLVGRLVGLLVVDGFRSMPLRRLRKPEWSELFRRVREFWLDGVLAQSFERLVVLVVGAMAGERATGFFHQARRLAVVPHQLADPVTGRIALNYFSHRVKEGERRKALRNLLGWTTGILAVVALGTVLLADPVVPWLFGREWAPVVPLLRAMAGVIVGMTTFNALNAYYMALSRLRPFVALGRGGQYGGLLAALAVLALTPIADIAFGLSAGLSAAYLIGSVASGWFAYTHRLTVREE